VPVSLLIRPPLVESPIFSELRIAVGTLTSERPPHRSETATRGASPLAGGGQRPDEGARAGMSGLAENRGRATPHPDPLPQAERGRKAHSRPAS
jgi:hypothetical protein